ncbi:MAG: ferrous iron transport protein A [Candidatus Omnitrophica bacterium]|nr:ferrous iron transport protein A [Candidatus Omnitrophota bacterium]
MAVSWLNQWFRPSSKAPSDGEISLKDMGAGHKAKILRLSGDDATAHRLREMGFRESALIEKNTDNGAIICKVAQARVAISKKLAQNIFVKDMGRVKNSMSEDLVLLSDMSVGQQGVIKDFTADNDDYERIVEMGVTPGEHVEIIRYAPLGDPIEIRVRGYLLSLRKAEAERIKVSVIN